MTRARSLAVVGRFPPPLDGQALATARLAHLVAGPLGGGWSVTRADVGAPEGDALVSVGGGGIGRAAHFVRRAAATRRALAAAPDAPILWTSISPSPLGHTRDVLTVVPTFGRRPAIAVVHRGDFERLFRSRATLATGRALVRRLAAVVFLTDRLAARCAPFVPTEKRLVIPNTIDDAAIPGLHELETSRSVRAGRDGVRLLFLSGMVRSKGYPDVLDALGVLRQRGVEATATFAGRWPSAEAETAFRARAEALDLGGAIRVLGGVTDRDRVRDLHLDADVFVLPTTYPVEAQPLTVIEALAAGTPVVTTRHAGLPEMVTPGVEGAFVAPGAPDAIADAVTRLSQPDRWSAASRSARARFERQFSPASVGARWQQVLESVGD